MRDFLGEPLGSALIKLIALSVVVGLVLAWWGISPWSLWEDFWGTIGDVWEFGFEAIDDAARYFVLGAVIVVPVWLLIRILNYIGGRNKSS